MVDHASLTGAALHEPKGVATAPVNTIYIADGAGSGDWDIPTFASMPSKSLVKMSYASSTSDVTTTTVIPSDGTIPQNTEGVEILTLSHTPLASSNILKISFFIPVVGINESYGAVAALFKDSDASAIAAVATDMAGGGLSYWGKNVLTGLYITTAGSTSARTYKLRIGNNRSTSFTLYANQSMFGNIDTSWLLVEEFNA